MRRLFALLPVLSCQVAEAPRSPDAGEPAPRPVLSGVAPSATPSTFPTTTPSAAPEVPAPAACQAPSLTATDPRAGRDEEALAHCAFDRSDVPTLADRCGQPGADRPVALARLDEAVPPLDEATTARVRSLLAEGKRQGRSTNGFGLVGDSITASPKFLRPFTDPRLVQLSDEVRAALALPDGTTVIERFRRPLYGVLDAYVAPRAAKVGAPSFWALRPTPSRSPVGTLVRQLSPAVAIVMYGSNDATTNQPGLAELVTGFREHMTAIVDQLEAAGIVPVLSTIPPHTGDPARPLCDRFPGDLSNWRIAVQTNALSAAVAELACARALPLVDLRHGLDALSDAGIGPDGVHPNAHRGGAGKLDAQGLQCGYNLRNYLTLRMLRQLAPLLDAP